MIIRIVKMTFREEELKTFQQNFHANKVAIRAFEGCHRLELLQDVKNPCIFFTYSWWDGEEYLNQYRHSELFKSVWSKTKPLFADKPEAWSLDQKAQLS